MGKRKSSIGALAAGVAMLTLSAFPAWAGDIIGLNGETISAGAYGFVPQDQAKEQLLTLMAPIAPFVADGMPNTTTVNQLGTGLGAHSVVEGESNFSYIQQSGSDNRAVQAIAGNNNALLLHQSGSGNSVLQASLGNDNFQIVGVSGEGNDVAYLQAGNELAGALSVGGQNSAVLAVQTPSSNNYLMPVGLNGLQDQVVVIVPGRMYVFNR